MIASIILGLISGLILGVYLGYRVGYLKSLPYWEAQGFARAKTPEEKKIVKDFMQSENFKVTTDKVYDKFLSSSNGFLLLIFVIVIFIFLNIIMPVINKELNLSTIIISSCIFTFIFMFLTFVTSAFMSDKTIRQNHKNNLISQEILEKDIDLLKYE